MDMFFPFSSSFVMFYSFPFWEMTRFVSLSVYIDKLGQCYLFLSSSRVVPLVLMIVTEDVSSSSVFDSAINLVCPLCFFRRRLG